MGKKKGFSVVAGGKGNKVELMKQREDTAPNIVLTNGEIEGILTSSTIKMLVENKNEVSIRTRHLLAHLAKEASEKVKLFIEGREELYREYCDKDDKKEPIFVSDGQGGKRYMFGNGAPSMQKKITELACIKHEFAIKRLWLDRKVVKLLSAQDMLFVESFADLDIPSIDEDE
jgi:hypothetical protein